MPRVNSWKELVETGYVDGVTIIGVPFYGLKGMGRRDHRDMTQNPTSVKVM